MRELTREQWERYQDRERQYIDIQNDIIRKYKIKIVKDSKCRSRTHAHCDGTRRICKWESVNSIKALFTLAHEVGHIMTYHTKMRRCESEYYATVWAIQELNRRNIKAPEKIIARYQRYIYNELNRGLRRNGTGYMSKEEMNLDNALNIELKLKKIPTDKVLQERINRKEAKLKRRII